nr:PREDICTED: uncharacterized protein LOC102345169 isoform X2 [Latimeria chalumnae]|eukprot:XP_014351381.1 PREDICTED: uncharacterized protein LOC102345169 isoform X2 [Latimeria chalumnae]
MKVYNVRYGVEFDLEPDSGLVLESATEQTASEGEESRPESTESNSRSPGFVITDEAELDEGFERTGGHILDSSVLCNEYLIMSQLQDSATLLEEAQSSMERLEEHIISGIKTLQHFTEYGDFGLSLQATADPQIENDSHVVPAGGIETDQEVGNGDVSPVLEAEIDSQFGSSKDWTSTSSSEVHFQVRGSKDASGFMASVGGQDVDTCSVAKVTEEGESKAAGMDVPSDLHREIALRDRARLLSAPLSYGFCSVVEPPVTNRPPVNRRKAGIGPTIRCITSATKGLHHSQSARTLPTNGNKADLSESVKRRATISGAGYGEAQHTARQEEEEEEEGVCGDYNPSLQHIIDFSAWVRNKECQKDLRMKGQVSTAHQSPRQAVGNASAAARGLEPVIGENNDLDFPSTLLETKWFETFDLMQEIIEELKGPLNKEPAVRKVPGRQASHTAEGYLPGFLQGGGGPLLDSTTAGPSSAKGHPLAASMNEDSEISAIIDSGLTSKDTLQISENTKDPASVNDSSPNSDSAVGPVGGSSLNSKD